MDSYELIDSIIKSLDSLEISHLTNWAIISDAIQKLTELKLGIHDMEDSHKKQMSKMMDRIKEISKGGVDFFDINEIEVGESSDIVDNGAEAV